MNNPVHPISSEPVISIPSQGLISLTYVIYALHLFSAVSGILTPAFVLTAFLSGWPSIIAVVLNYVKRNEVTGSYLESHFRWQIRTFWFSLLWLFGSVVVALTFFGIPIAFLMVCFTGVWVLYRIIRGLLTLAEEKSIKLS